MAVTALAILNVNLSIESNEISKVTLYDVESLSNELNSITQWWSQGLTKDEREWIRPCPASQSNSGSGSVSYNGASVSGSGSSSQTNNNERSEITCPYGSDNCSEVPC